MQWNATVKINVKYHKPVSTYRHHNKFSADMYIYDIFIFILNIYVTSSSKFCICEENFVEMFTLPERQLKIHKTATMCMVRDATLSIGRISQQARFFLKLSF